MAEFQWWLLLVGLVAGGGLVFVVSMDARRREEDLAELERRAEATWIAERLARREPGAPDAPAVEAVLRAHLEYLSLPPPDRLLVDEGVEVESAPDRNLAGGVDTEVDLDVDPDRAADDVRDSGRRGADEDLANPAEEHAPAREEAHAGADREQRSE